MSHSTFNLVQAKDVSLVKLLQKLDTAITVIEGLLSMSVAKRLVEKKINHLEELVAKIPPAERVLAAEWREKLVCLWVKYADVDASLTTSRTEVPGRQYRLSENRFGSVSTMSEEVANLDSTTNEHPRQYSDQFSVISEAKGPTTDVSAKEQINEASASSSLEQLSRPSPGPLPPAGLPTNLVLLVDNLLAQLSQHEAEFNRLIKSGATRRQSDTELSKLLELVDSIPKHDSLASFTTDWRNRINIYLDRYLDTFTTKPERQGDPLSSVSSPKPWDATLDQFEKLHQKVQLLMSKNHLDQSESLVDEMRKLYQSLGPEVPFATRQYCYDSINGVNHDMVQKKVHQFAVKSGMDDEIDQDTLRTVEPISLSDYCQNLSENAEDLKKFYELRNSLKQILEAPGPMDWTVIDEKMIKLMEHIGAKTKDLCMPLQVKLNEATEKLWALYNKVKDAEVDDGRIVMSSKHDAASQMVKSVREKRPEEDAKVKEEARRRPIGSSFVPYSSDDPIEMSRSDRPIQQSEKTASNGQFDEDLELFTGWSISREQRLLEQQSGQPSFSASSSMTSQRPPDEQQSQGPDTPRPLVSPPLTAQDLVPPQLDVSSERPSISSPTPSDAHTQPAITMPMSDADIIKLLDRLEVFICTLFAQSSPPVVLIEQYLSQLVALLGQLPPSLNEIADEWLTKIGSFMMQFATLSAVDKRKPGEIALEPLVYTSTDQLKKDLTSLVFATEKLLDCKPPPPRRGIIERNIGRINEAIRLIPSYEVELCAEFNAKLQSLIVRWLTLKDDGKDLGKAADTTTLAEAKAVKPDVNVQVIDDNSKAPDLADRRLIQEMYGSDDEGDEFTIRELPLRVPLTVKEVRGRVAKAFRRLGDPFRYGKADGIKALICLAAKSRFLLKHLDSISYSAQKDLRDEIYSWAVGKLPEEMYRSYCASTTSIQDMNALIDYLCEQQVYCHNLAMEYEAGGIADGFVKTEDAPPGDDANTGPCRYCRHTGHSLIRCPLRLMVLCFNCFQYGHGKKYCSNDTIKLYDLVI